MMYRSKRKKLFLELIHYKKNGSILTHNAEKECFLLVTKSISLKESDNHF